jgi:hypothetical protein
VAVAFAVTGWTALAVGALTAAWWLRVLLRSRRAPVGRRRETWQWLRISLLAALCGLFVVDGTWPVPVRWSLIGAEITVLAWQGGAWLQCRRRQERPGLIPGNSIALEAYGRGRVPVRCPAFSSA